MSSPIAGVPENPRADFDRATGALHFTKDFNTSLDALMGDVLAPLAQRVLAWIKRRAWGNYSLYCTDRPDGDPVFAADCARDLKVNPGSVSRAISYQEQRGYVDRKGSAKLLYPVIDPQLSDALVKVATSATFSQFIADWKVAHAATFSELEVAEATAKRIRKVVLAAFHEWQTLQQKAPHPYESLGESSESKRDEQTNCPVSEDPPVRPSVPAPPELTAEREPAPPAPAEPAVPEDIWRWPPEHTLREDTYRWLTARASRFGLLTALDKTVTDELMVHITTPAILARFEAQVEKQKPQPESWRYFISIAANCAAAEVEARPPDHATSSDGTCPECGGRGLVRAVDKRGQTSVERCICQRSRATGTG